MKASMASKKLLQRLEAIENMLGTNESSNQLIIEMLAELQTAKPKRKRRTKAEIEADEQAKNQAVQ